MVMLTVMVMVVVTVTMMALQTSFTPVMHAA